MKKIWDFLQITPPTLSYTSKIFQSIMESIFEQYTEIKTSITTLISQAFANKNSYFLEQLAQDRGIKRIRNESWESFQNRIAFAFPFLRNASTLEGIKNIIAKTTNKKFQIREVFKERWILGDPKELLGETTHLGKFENLFFFIIESEPLTEEEKNALEEIINIYKPAHVGFNIREIDFPKEQEDTNPKSENLL